MRVLVGVAVGALGVAVFASVYESGGQGPPSAIEPASEAVGSQPAPASPIVPPPAPLSDAGTTTVMAAVSDANAADPEAARIQRYLDSRYKRSDVVSSFRTRFGEDIDCISFYAQPAVRAMMARGEKPPILDADQIRKMMGPRPAVEPGPLDDVAFTGQPDENGRPRKCFGETVPMVRHTVAQIKAVGGLNAYLKRSSRKPPPMPRPVDPKAPTDDPGYMHVMAQLGEGGPPIFAGLTTASIYAPSFGDAGSHSLSQTWMLTGSQFAPCSEGTPTGSCVATFGSQCYQSIEVGWTVDPVLNMGDTQPHMFVFSTQDGYWSTGCYNTESCAPEACWFNADQAGQPDEPQSAEPCNQFLSNGDLEPSPFIIEMNAPFTPEQALPASVLGSTPVEIGLETLNFFGTWALTVTINNMVESPMGYWPPSTWDGGVYTSLNGGHQPAGLATTPGAPLSNGGQVYQVGGEVAGNVGPLNPFGLTPEPFTLSTPGGNPAMIPMGSGVGGAIGFKASAYHRNVSILVGSDYGSTISPPFDPVGIGNPVSATDMNCYSFGYGLADGGPQTVSLNNLGYTFLQYEAGVPTSFKSPPPGGSNWGNYVYFGGLGNASGFPFSVSDPNGGTYDFCCSTAKQNGVGADNQCPNSQLTNVCP